MKKNLIFLFAGVLMLLPNSSLAYDFENTSSSVLVAKAWEALAQEDVDAVIAYADKCVEMHNKRATMMQNELKDYPKDTDDKKINSYWALNDVATALYIKGEALLKAQRMDEAKQAYQEVIDKYKFGQCWDPQGWFWKPAESAQERLAMIESGVILEFGDHRSVTLVVKAWKALEQDDFMRVMGYTNKCIKLYEKKAQEMQASLTDFVQGAPEEIHKFWALNDVATALFIQGQALEKEQRFDEAKLVYQQIIDKYKFGQCWDPKGWFWKPSEVAKLKLAQ